jgi:gamma-glutamylcyclotransferase (GGCT)/AIG2-like uncharacterized protein YtfP
MLNVFVYGTLKPGEINYHVCARYVKSAQPAIAAGQLYALPLGYPAMTPGSTLVHGFVLSFTNQESLDLLDRFEQHDPEEFSRYASNLAINQNQYRRQKIEILDQNQNRLEPAWAYLMAAEQVKRLGGILLPDGKWSYEKQKLAFSERCQHLG